MENYYRPLPNMVTIKQSNIEGLGLFASDFIPKNTFLGITHVRHENCKNNYIRTPLGGFYNHNENPNALSLFSEKYVDYIPGSIIDIEKYKNDIQNPQYRFMISLKDIEKDQEIVLKYNLYNPEN